MHSPCNGFPCGAQGAIGIFYYSGHGIGSDGDTYLLPVDLGELLVGKDQTVKNTQDIGVKVSSIAKQMESAGTAQSIIILDSCRTRLSGDPVVKGSADGHPSFAKIVDLPRGTRTVIAFAATAGNVALQNIWGRKHSVYTHHFLEAAKSSDGLAIVPLLERVASSVTKATRQDGVPENHSNDCSSRRFCGATHASPCLVHPSFTMPARRPCT
jgi:uncharacterized caspase-like protein